jgi:hypothetical protein
LVICPTFEPPEQARIMTCSSFPQHAFDMAFSFSSR